MNKRISSEINAFPLPLMKKNSDIAVAHPGSHHLEEAGPARSCLARAQGRRPGTTPIWPVTKSSIRPSYGSISSSGELKKDRNLQASHVSGDRIQIQKESLK